MMQFFEYFALAWKHTHNSYLKEEERKQTTKKTDTKKVTAIQAEQQTLATGNRSNHM